MAASARGGATGYAAVPGIPALRAAIARRVAARTGVPTASANVMVTAGGQAALFAALKATCDPGNSALIVDPYYATYPGTVRAAGARPVAVPADPTAGFQPAAPHLHRAAAAASGGARALVVNTPNNPTGAVYDDETLAAIAGTCAAHDLWLISDEVYDSQVWEGVHRSPRAVPGMAARTLVVGSLSKSHAMTGSRLGWVIGPPAIVASMIDLSTHTTYGVPGYIQDAGLHALSMGPAFEDRIAAPFRRRRGVVLEALSGQGVVRAVPAAGAMYVMLDIRATGLSGTAFAEALLEVEAIAVMPGESFGQAAAGHLRLALTRPDAELADAVARLVRFAAGRQARRRAVIGTAAR